MRRRADVHAAVELAVSRFGGVDIVVAVAGIGALQPLLEIDDESWQRVIDVNLTGVFLTVQEGARAMVAGGRAGAIVVVSSTNAVYAEESTAHYTASKGGAVSFVKAASLDLARHGIRINAVAPDIAISIHQDRLFPADSGRIDETGPGNVNVPLPPGCGEGAYFAAMGEVVVPALQRFEPELILVACGYDAAALDPLGRMMLRSHSFAKLTRAVLDAAGQLCGGRVVLCHEGGYSEPYVPFCALAVLEALTGSRTEVEDPYFPPQRELAYDGLQDHQRRAVDAAAAALA